MTKQNKIMCIDNYNKCYGINEKKKYTFKHEKLKLREEQNAQTYK